MKIAYCLNSISHMGGIGRIAVVKANALAEIVGNEIFVIVTDHDMKSALASKLSADVRLVNLDIKYYEDDWKSQWHVLKGILFKRRLHKKRLSKVLNEIRPDVVISLGQAEKYMLPEIKGSWVTIREMHYHKDFRRLAAETSHSMFYKISAGLSNFYDYNCKIGKYDSIVTLTQEDKVLNWKKTEKVTVIPNLLTLKNNKVSELKRKKVIAVGRLTVPKNFSSLIRAFQGVTVSHPDWVLEIYGNGSEYESLRKLIMDLRLYNNVYLCGNTMQVQEKMCDSSIFVLSSIFEGFGLVITEAMSCGLPVVSYDCPCGPKDIITDGVDGFLVSTGDEQMLAEKICYLIENPDIRTQMGAAALKKSEKYRPEKIISMWMSLFERLLAEKRNKC